MIKVAKKDNVHFEKRTEMPLILQLTLRSFDLGNNTNAHGVLFGKYYYKTCKAAQLNDGFCSAVMKKIIIKTLHHLEKQC